MNDQRMIRTIRLRNILSFGPESEAVELRPLNVLIGPNASGKSNFIEALGFLHAAPGDLTAPIRDGGGIGEWLWKGSPRTPIAEIELTLPNPKDVVPLLYKLAFTAVGERLELDDESIELETPIPGERDVYFFYRYQHGDPIINARTIGTEQSQRNDNRSSRRLR